MNEVKTSIDELVLKIGMMPAKGTKEGYVFMAELKDQRYPSGSLISGESPERVIDAIANHNYWSGPKLKVSKSMPEKLDNTVGTVKKVDQDTYNRFRRAASAYNKSLTPSSR